MINRIDAPESYPGQRAERIARAVALLSLDIVRPVYTCLAVDVQDPAPFQALLREAIEANRRASRRDPHATPNLLREVGSTLTRGGMAAEARRLHRWLQSTFVCGPDDYRPYSTFQDLLSRASRDRDIEEQLGLPEPIRAKIFDALPNRRSVTCLDEKYVGLDEDPLSEWDAEVCIRMRFYHEHRDPYVPLRLTCGWLDFLPVARIVAGGTTRTERGALTRRVEEAARRIGLLRSEDSLPSIEGLVEDHA